ncbi:MAG: hypothetical protein R2932_59715 [Caldilineaceae bacterium]
MAYGELLIGIGLIIGAFVGIAASFGALLNWNFIMAGAASTNGLLLVVCHLARIGLKAAGYYGAGLLPAAMVELLPWGGDDEADQSTPSTTGQFKPSSS